MYNDGSMVLQLSPTRTIRTLPQARREYARLRSAGKLGGRLEQRLLAAFPFASSYPCPGCGGPVASQDVYCGECACEDDCAP